MRLRMLDMTLNLRILGRIVPYVTKFNQNIPRYNDKQSV